MKSDDQGKKLPYRNLSDAMQGRSQKIDTPRPGMAVMSKRGQVDDRKQAPTVMPGKRSLSEAMGGKKQDFIDNGKDRGGRGSGDIGKEKPTDPGFYVGSSIGGGALEELREKRKRKMRR